MRYLAPLKRARIYSTSHREKVLSGDDEEHFFGTFKMPKEQFDFIVNLIKDHEVFARRGRKPQAPVERQLKVALYRLTHYGDLASYANISRTLSVSVGSVNRYVKRCVVAICAHITTYIRWPTQEEKEVIKQQPGKGNFPDIIGAVDGTTIPLVRAPLINKDKMATRKSDYAIGATAVCDHRGVFTFFFTGYYGTRHDSASYKSTKLYQEKELYFQFLEYIIGDAAYALTPTVITAFKGKRQPPDQDTFNKCLRSSRVKIEHAFGWLKAKFSCLRELRYDYSGLIDMALITRMIMACVVLYNLGKIHNFCSDDEELDLGGSQFDVVDEDSFGDDSSDDDGEDVDGGERPINRTPTDNAILAELPYQVFPMRVERERYERNQRVLGERKRQALKAAIEAREEN